jgi:trans-2,3-dihydro-3-hydroxyanthranilate isomerase
MQLDFTTVDVFTDRRFGGNPLAVVTNAQGLSTQQMQAIAAEFNLAETTFVLPPKDPAHTAEVRIFTPKAEMPFAGHPNVGTAFVLARAGQSYGRAVAGDRLAFEEKAGLVRLELTREGGVVVATRLAAPVPLSIGAKSHRRSWPRPARSDPTTSRSRCIGPASPRAASRWSSPS